MWDPYAAFERHVLPNGLEVYAAQWPDRDFQNLDIIIHSGGGCDPQDHPGVAHFLEHVIGENAPQPRDEMQAFLNDNGGGANWGSTSWMGARYGFFVPAQPSVIAKTLDLFGHMLVQPTIVNGVDQERAAILGEWHQDFPIPAMSFDLISRMRRALYREHPLARFVNVLGTPESIEHMSRTVLQAYCDQWYTPANMSIVTVGRLSLAELCNILAASPFAQAMPGERAPAFAPFDPLPPAETFVEVNLGDHMPSMRNGNYKSVVALSGVEGQSYAYPIIREVLGHLFHKEVRERRGWTYSVMCTQVTLGVAHEFGIQCRSLAPEGFEHIHNVINECIKEAAVRQDLFDREKRRRLARLRLADRNSQEVLTGATMDLLELRRLQTHTDLIAELEALEFSHYQRALERLAPERRWTVLSTP